jgi:hypothetical protein
MAAHTPGTPTSRPAPRAPLHPPHALKHMFCLCLHLPPLSRQPITTPAPPQASWEGFCAFPPSLGLACRRRPDCCVMGEVGQKRFRQAPVKPCQG